MVVATEGVAPVRAVVREVSEDAGTGGCGGVTSSLVVVTTRSGIDISCIVVLVVVVATAGDVEEVKVGLDVAGT